MRKRLLVGVAVMVLGVCSACEPGPRNKNQRDAKLEAQRQRLNAAIGHLEAEFDSAALEAKRVYQDAKREALVIQGNAERKIAQVDRAAQAYIDRAKAVEQLAGAAGDKVDRAQQALGGMLGYEAPRHEETPVGRKEP